MVPSSWLSVLFFFLFVAPGALFLLLSRRRRTMLTDSTFLEICRVVLASLGFSGFAVAVLAGVRKVRPHWMPEPRRLLAQGGADYFRDRYALVLRAVICGAVLACLAAWVWNAILAKRQGGATIRHDSAWRQVLKLDRPSDKDVYARVRLDDGFVYSGLVVDFSTDLEVEGRELVLGQPLLSGTGAGPLEPVPARYQRVVIPGDSIKVMSVEYRPISAGLVNDHAGQGPHPTRPPAAPEQEAGGPHGEA